jgi:hypothetical protein
MVPHYIRKKKQLRRGALLRHLPDTFRLLLAIVGPIVVILGASYIWDEGYLGSHWKRYGSMYDPKSEGFRCLDEHGELTRDIMPPCLVLTMRGQKAMARHQTACEKDGGNKEACHEGAFQWLVSKQPSNYINKAN